MARSSRCASGCYVVADVRQSALPPDVLARLDGGPQHLVTLSSVEDDALGEELQVVWEVEPGAEVLEKATLPRPGDGLDDPTRFDAFLNAVRWGAATSADVQALQSPFRSGITIEDYQLDPVVRAIQMPRANLLIADDVGLGKTIEAGLVIQELILRHRARTVLVVCPAALQLQWRDQMRDKFGLEFRVVDAAMLRELRRQRGLHVNPWTHFPRLIVSIDFLKRERPLRLLCETLPAEDAGAYPRRFDLLLVDEAHNVAPSGRGKYATDSLRTLAIRTLAPHFEHRLFLSATPHNGYPESFTALLELLDNQRFARGVPPDRAQLQAVMVRRLKSELPPLWNGQPRFPRRELAPIEVDYPAAEREMHTLLQRYTALRRAGAHDETETVATEFVLKLLKKRLFSSPEAFAKTLAQHRLSLSTAVRRTAQARPTAGILRRQIEQVEEEFGSDELADAAQLDAVEVATRLFRQPTAEETALLDAMQRWAETARGKPDAKLSTLIAWLRATCQPSGTWNDTRVIIFTEYRDTQRWLQTLLATAGLADRERLLVLHGGVDTEDREQIKAAFQASPSLAPVRILLATDAASEGIDLQNHCSRLIHYEIPWNPNRLEQRNGRIDRHGQHAAQVEIFHFVGAGWQQQGSGGPVGDLEADLEFLMRAALKVNTIREDLGRVGPVIAQQVEEAMLGQRRTLDTAAAEHAAAPIKRLLTFERKLWAQIEGFDAQIKESRRALQLTPDHVASVVHVALALAQQPPLIPTTLADGQPAWRVPALRGSWASCSVGLAHPHTQQLRPITFDQTLAAGRDDVVLAHLNHRLVQMALRLLRAEVWAPQAQQQLTRVTARRVMPGSLDTPAVLVHARLLVLGADHQRLHEEVVVAGGLVRAGRLTRASSAEVVRMLAVVTPQPAPAAVVADLVGLWDTLARAALKLVAQRAGEREGQLRALLVQRATQEAAALTTVLQELAATIRRELDQASGDQQLSLFSDPEREQFEANRNSLERRLARIPEEISTETAAIARRYATLQVRVFPVAVTLLSHL